MIVGIEQTGLGQAHHQHPLLLVEAKRRTPERGASGKLRLRGPVSVHREVLGDGDIHLVGGPTGDEPHHALGQGEGPFEARRQLRTGAAAGVEDLQVQPGPQVLHPPESVAAEEAPGEPVDELVRAGPRTSPVGSPGWRQPGEWSVVLQSTVSVCPSSLMWASAVCGWKYSLPPLKSRESAHAKVI